MQREEGVWNGCLPFFIRKKELRKEKQGSTLREAQMICTVTLNPALDYTLDVKDFRLGEYGEGDTGVTIVTFK